MPQFSIIIPVYNVQNHLAACLKSVAEQPGPRDWECLLIDDGSTDLTGSICDALAAEIPGLQVLHQARTGPTAARNTGLQAATGDWVLFLDGDNAMAPGLLETLRAALPAHPECDWFIGRHRVWQADGTLTEPEDLRLVPGPFDSTDYAARLKALYTAGRWSVQKYCIRRSFLVQSGVRFLPDCVWGGDWPFDLELLLRCERLYFLDTVFVHCRSGRQGNPLTDAQSLPRHFRSLAAAQRRLATLSATGRGGCCRLCGYAGRRRGRFLAADAHRRRAGCVRAPACLPYLAQLRPLYPHGTEVRTRRTGGFSSALWPPSARASPSGPSASGRIFPGKHLRRLSAENLCLFSAGAVVTAAPVVLYYP